MKLIECRSKSAVLHAIQMASYEEAQEVVIKCGTFEMTLRNPVEAGKDWYACVCEARKQGLRRLYRKVKQLPQKIFEVPQ